MILAYDIIKIIENKIEHEIRVSLCTTLDGETDKEESIFDVMVEDLNQIMDKVPE